MPAEHCIDMIVALLQKAEREGYNPIATASSALMHWAAERSRQPDDPLGPHWVVNLSLIRPDTGDELTEGSFK